MDYGESFSDRKKYTPLGSSVDNIQKLLSGVELVTKSRFENWCKLAVKHSSLSLTIDEVSKLAGLQGKFDAYEDIIGKYVYSSFAEIQQIKDKQKKAIIYRCLEFLAKESVPNKKNNYEHIEEILLQSKVALHCDEVIKNLTFDITEIKSSLDKLINDHCIVKVVPDVYIHRKNYSQWMKFDLQNQRSVINHWLNDNNHLGMEEHDIYELILLLCFANGSKHLTGKSILAFIADTYEKFIRNSKNSVLTIKHPAASNGILITRTLSADLRPAFTLEDRGTEPIEIKEVTGICVTSDPFDPASPIDKKVERWLFKSFKALHYIEIEEALEEFLSQDDSILDILKSLDREIKQLLPRVYIHRRKITGNYSERLKEEKIAAYQIISERLDEEWCKISEKELAIDVWESTKISCLSEMSIPSLIKHVVNYAGDLFVSEGMIGKLKETKREGIAPTSMTPFENGNRFRHVTVAEKVESILLEKKKALHYKDVENYIFENFGTRHAANGALAKSEKAIKILPGVFIHTIFFTNEFKSSLCEEENKVKQLVLDNLKKHNIPISISKLGDIIYYSGHLKYIPKAAIPYLIRKTITDDESFGIDNENIYLKNLDKSTTSLNVNKPSNTKYNLNSSENNKVITVNKEKNSDLISSQLFIQKLYRAEKPENLITKEIWSKWSSKLINSPFAANKLCDIARDLKLIWPSSQDTNTVGYFLGKPFFDICNIPGWAKKKTLITSIAWTEYLFDNNVLLASTDSTFSSKKFSNINYNNSHKEHSNSFIKGKNTTQETPENIKSDTSGVENKTGVQPQSSVKTLPNQVTTRVITAKNKDIELIKFCDEETLVTLFSMNTPQDYVNPRVWHHWHQLFRFDLRFRTTIDVIAEPLNLFWPKIYSNLTFFEVIKKKHNVIIQEFEPEVLRTMILSLVFMVVSASDSYKNSSKLIEKCCHTHTKKFQSTKTLQPDFQPPSTVPTESMSEPSFRDNLNEEKKSDWISRLNNKKIDYVYLQQFDEPWVHVDDSTWDDWRRLARSRCPIALKTDDLARRLGLYWPLGKEGFPVVRYFDWHLKDLRVLFDLKKKKTIFLEVAYFAFNEDLPRPNPIMCEGSRNQPSDNATESFHKKSDEDILSHTPKGESSFDDGGNMGQQEIIRSEREGAGWLDDILSDFNT